MENKYTPGPWITEKSGSAIWIGPNFHRTDGKVELIVTHINIDPEYKKGVLAKNEANAKLIAAAPELLEALEEMIDEVGVKFLTDRQKSAFNKGIAAVKKATE